MRMGRLWGLMALLWALGAWAHSGEDHDTPAVAPATVMASPRAWAQTPDFELVVAWTAAELTLTLDRFATNEPVADALLDVESGTQLKAQAHPVAPGVYKLALPAGVLPAPGHWPLTVMVQAGDDADLLTLTLEVPPPAMSAAATVTERRSAWGAWIGAALLLALLLAGVWGWQGFRGLKREVSE